MNAHVRAVTIFVLVLPILAVLSGTCPHAAAIDFPGPAPGKADVAISDGLLRLENNVLRLDWQVIGHSLRPVQLRDKLSGRTVALDGAECFQLLLSNTPLPGNQILRASELRVSGSPDVEAIPADATSPRLADRQPGKGIVVKLGSPDKALEVIWRAMLRDGSNYVAQRVSCRATQKAVELAEVVLWDLALPGAEVQGVVDGSPVVAGNLFFAAEHPLSKSRLAEAAAGGRAPRFTCSYPVHRALQAGRPQEFRGVVGAVPEGQLRRGFLYYLERERVQPYRQFLHYNNGYEIGYVYSQAHQSPERLRETTARLESLWLELIHTFGRELTQKRGVPLESFVHDWGWDDETRNWQFHAGYPLGFTPAQKAAAQYGSHLGIWLSPRGDTYEKIRREKGRQSGFETNASGLSLAGPHYYDRFHAACTGMLDRYGVNYFKFDGFALPGPDNPTGPGAFFSDVEALLHLIAGLRQRQPGLFINTSSGSWPSPFWLLHADAIWRQGYDSGLGAKGSDRQRWITYRDDQIYQGTVRRGPLLPINSLMIHGIFINEFPFFTLRTWPTYDGADMTAEIRSFFATGVNLQELYINPKFMTERMWDVLAEAARWARAHAHVMADTHWVGGNPAKNEVYGFASWTPGKAVLMLRNPDDRPARFSLDVERAFELPPGAPGRYRLRSPWADDAARPAVEVVVGRPHLVSLAPFEALVLEAAPIN